MGKATSILPRKLSYVTVPTSATTECYYFSKTSFLHNQYNYQVSVDKNHDILQKQSPVEFILRCKRSQKKKPSREPKNKSHKDLLYFLNSYPEQPFIMTKCLHVTYLYPSLNKFELLVNIQKSGKTKITPEA